MSNFFELYSKILKLNTLNLFSSKVWRCGFEQFNFFSNTGVLKVYISNSPNIISKSGIQNYETILKQSWAQIHQKPTQSLLLSAQHHSSLGPAHPSPAPLPGHGARPSPFSSTPLLSPWAAAQEPVPGLLLPDAALSPSFYSSTRVAKTSPGIGRAYLKK